MPSIKSFDGLGALRDGQLKPFAYSEGVLNVDGRTMTQLVSEFGSPFVAYSASRVRANAARIHSAFTTTLRPPVRSAFALKCCYLPAVVRAIVAAGWGVEVMSSLELELALGLGFGADQITLTGLGWSEALCTAAIQASVFRFVVDSESDAQVLSDVAVRMGRTASIFVRVNLEDSVGGTFLARDCKLGVSTAQLPHTLRRLEPLRGLVLRGLHVHQMNRVSDLALYERILDSFVQTIHMTRALRFPVKEVDLGGGFDSLWHLDRMGHPIEDFATSVAVRLNNLDLESVALQVGRAVVADAGIAVGTIVGVKQSSDVTWAIVDVPTNTLIPIPGATYVPVPVRLMSHRPNRICSFSDGTGSPVAYCEGVSFPDPRVGDQVCFLDAGAYTTVFSELWGYEMPSLVVLDRNATHVRRARSTTAATIATWFGDSAWEQQTR